MTDEPALPAVDAGKCVGYGLCHDHASRYLEMDDDGITRVRADVTGVPADGVAAIESAIAACPAEAIAWARRPG